MPFPFSHVLSPSWNYYSFYAFLIFPEHRSPLPVLSWLPTSSKPSHQLPISTFQALHPLKKLKILSIKFQTSRRKNHNLLDHYIQNIFKTVTFCFSFEWDFRDYILVTIFQVSRNTKEFQRRIIFVVVFRFPSVVLELRSLWLSHCLPECLLLYHTCNQPGGQTH